MNVRRQFLLSLLAASLFPQWGGAQELPTDVRQEIGKFLDTTARKEVSVGRISIDSVAVGRKCAATVCQHVFLYISFARTITY